MVEFSRRSLLGTAAAFGGMGVVATGVGFVLRGGDGGRKPTGTAREFLQALDSGDLERAKQLTDDETSIPESLVAWHDRSVTIRDLSIESRERTDAGTLATVGARVRVEGGDSAREERVTIILREADRWTVVNVLTYA